MSLPNYFLADQPPEAVLRPALAVEACQSLRRNRNRFLLPRSTESIIQALLEVARSWVSPQSPWRARALERSPLESGACRELLGEGLDGFFRQFSSRSFNTLLVQELGHPQRLDRLVAGDAESLHGFASMVRGPEVLALLTSEDAPVALFTSMIHALLVRSALLVKCSPGTSWLPRLFAHSIRDIEPKLASCLEVAEWTAGDAVLERAIFEEIDCVLASDTEAVIEGLRRVLPGRVRLVARPSRVSAGYVTREMLGPRQEAAVLEATVQDVIAWNQLGALAPQVVFVETGGMMPPELFGARLAEELAKCEQRFPRGPVPSSVEADLRLRREYYRVRAGAGDSTRYWASGESTAWTVVYEADTQFRESPRHRFVYVKAVESVEECLHQAEPFRGRWSTMGLAAEGLRAGELAGAFANWGVTRICPLGRMQQPPLTWRHDGRPGLGDLVTWVQWEQAG